MSIRNKLIAGFLLVALLAGLVGYFGSRATALIGGEFETAAEEVLPAIEALEQLRFAGARIVASTMELIFLLHQGPELANGNEAKESEESQLAEGIAAYRQTLARSRTEITHLPRHHGEALAAITAAGERLIGCAQQLAAEARTGANRARLTALKEEFEALEQDYLAEVAQAIGHTKEHLETSKHRVLLAIARTQRTVFGGSILAFLLALLGGTALAAHIARPLQRLSEGAEQIGQGLLTTRIPISSKDELGELTAGFNRMAEQLETAEKETSAARSHLDNIIRSMADALFVTSATGTILSVNPAAVTLLESGEESLQGRTFGDFFRAAESEHTLLDTMLAKGSIQGAEATFRTAAGSEVPVLLSGAVIAGTDGNAPQLVWLAHDMSERQRAEAEIRQLAFFDPLTGLPNRTLFHDRLGTALARAERENSPVALLFLDLDRFKDVNDTLGHPCGDRLLQQVAERLLPHVRRSDTLARLGGDEFVLIMSATTSEQGAALVAQKIMEQLAAPFSLEGKEIFISTSIGIVLYPSDGYDGDTLLRHADLALYAAKERGRNVYCFFSEEMNRKTLERRALEASMRRALQNGEFFLEYQPQFDLPSGRMISAEALIRWLDPQLGRITPDRFIPAAEESNLIHPIGEWVLRSACTQAKAWQAAGFPLRVAVNISARQFLQPGLVNAIDRVLAETGLEPCWLELELTESTLMANAAEAAATLTALKERGIQLAIDDFGTGYSSLSYLKYFPLDRLKIDRSFVRDITIDPDDAGIVTAIISMASNLGLRVIAEGVETEPQLSFLQERGCNEAQGFLLGRPMPPEQIKQLLVTEGPAAATAQAAG